MASLIKFIHKSIALLCLLITISPTKVEGRIIFKGSSDFQKFSINYGRLENSTDLLSKPTDVSTTQKSFILSLTNQTSDPITKDPTDLPTTLEPTTLPSTHQTNQPTTEEPTDAPTTLEPTTLSPTNQTNEPTTEDPTDVPATLEPTTIPPTNQTNEPITDDPTDIPTTSDPTLAPTTEPTTIFPEDGRKECKGAGVWSNVAGMDEWCNTNCNAIIPYCLPSHCVCEL
uniref:Putative LOC100903330 [Metaseiulus occidentalis] n=1 Tax=Lepeophtheirus salmonis TaxID=72036 RepID=A0A0K2T0P2_LEPSM